MPPAWWVEPRRATRCQERKLQEWRLDCRGDRGTQMAAVSRAVVRQDGDNRMTNKTNNSLTPVAHQPGRLPARTNNTYAGGAPAWTSTSPRETTARQREPREGLSARRREQGLVETAEEGPGHHVERLRQCLTVAVAGCRSVALRRDFGNRHQCRPRSNRGSGTAE